MLDSLHPAADEKEQLTWLPSLTLPASTRSASALPAARRVARVDVDACVGVGGVGPAVTEMADTTAAHSSAAWRAISDRRLRSAAVRPAPNHSAMATAVAAALMADLSSGDESAHRAPFNSSAARFAMESARQSGRTDSSVRRPATAQHSSHSASAPVDSPAPVPPPSFTCPSYSRKGFGVGFASSTGRFPRSRRSKPAPGSYEPSQQLQCAHSDTRHHAALASAAFHSANHFGRCLPPQPSQPRVASAAVTAQSPPSVPFVSPYFLRRPTPAPDTYQRLTAAHAVRAASIGNAARQAPFGEQPSRLAEPSPSAASYDPLWQVSRPSSSNAASAHFASLTRRMEQPQQQQHAAIVARALHSQRVHNDSTQAHCRPDSGHQRRSQPHKPPSTASHAPQPARFGAVSGRLSFGASGAVSPSPAAYNVRVDSSRPHAPQHSFAPPSTQLPTGGVAALTVTRGGPGLLHNLTKAGRAAEKERWLSHQPATDSTSNERPISSSGRNGVAGAGLSVSDSTDPTKQKSFHFNRSHLWL